MDRKRRILRKNKTIAVGLMIAAVVMFIIARFHKGIGYWEWIGAFSEAALIGALADWFAVVALFRHPLGIPIPHTAIVPGKKNTIAESLAEFIRDKFLATESLVEKLRGINPAEKLAVYLSSRENAACIASGASRVIGESLDFIDDSRIQKVFHSSINNRIDKIDLAATTARILDFLKKDNRHQYVLDEILRRLSAWLAIPESQAIIATAIDKWANNEYPLLCRMIPNRDQFMKGTGEKIAKSFNGFIQEVTADPNHELRARFDEILNDFIDRLKNDDSLKTKINTIKHSIITNPVLSDYINTIWIDIKAWLHDDLNSRDSNIRTKLTEAATILGNTLSKNSDLKDSINDHIEGIVKNYADTLRMGFARHISGTIKQWKDEDFVSEIELSIGSDLQFIRMNGTLVGGLIGLIIHAVSLMI